MFKTNAFRIILKEGRKNGAVWSSAVDFDWQTDWSRRNRDFFYLTKNEEKQNHIIEGYSGIADV